MDIRPIKTEADYDWALQEIARYFEAEPEPGTPEADRFDVLSDLIAAYEERQYPLPQPDPVAVIRHVMEQRGGQAGLATLLGSRSRASEVLNRKRPLTLEMIRLLQKEWQIPAELLVAPYQLVA